MKKTNPAKIIAYSLGLTALAFLAMTSGLQAQTLQCVDTNVVKVFLPPNIDGGLDVRDSRQGIVLADDFLCTNKGPITDIHIWGSWLSNNHGTITNFWIGIYNDVPAVLNPLNGQVITPSHPGQNLLWQQSFGLGQYAESVAGTGSEQFYDPSNRIVIGADTMAWLYCFYPTNPFVQQGSANSPTNYWLAVYAQISDPTTLFGWKTSLIPYNDAAVWGAHSGGVPIGNWQPMTNSINQQLIHLSMKLETTNAAPPNPVSCVETNGTKYVQWPNSYGGMDVLNNPYVLADDFVCINPGPITDIHIWGSWLNDSALTNSLTFWLGIYDDVPANAANPVSHPGTNLLWQQWFSPGQYAETQWGLGQEYFLDPGPGQIVGGDSVVWYYCFNPTNPFVQTGSSSASKTYWLAAYTTLPSGSSGHNYGWKTTTNVLHDISVHALWPGAPPINNPGWTTNSVPAFGPLDLAFKLTTPPMTCSENNGVKYEQGPNTLGGFDIWNTPYILADDFVCTNPGAISDIHLWGSWLYDNALSNSITFWLGIYDDVPASTGPVPAPSHPGTNLLWQQWFSPGQYAETIWTVNASELFLDPGQPAINGSDSVVWYYCFYPTNPFVQMGTVATNKIYWLAAYAQLPLGIPQSYGWKTTTNVLNDISVHAPWPGIPPISNPGWTPTLIPSGAPLDLAFKLTTCGPVKIVWLGPANVVVSWPGGGFLQSATNVLGPYIDVPGFPLSPYTDTTVIPPTKRFYRLRCN